VDAFLTSSPVSSNPQALDDLSGDRPAVPLGLTFSFPVEQTALDQGYLLTWTKGFAAKNAIGNDVVKLLQDAFDRKHMHVKCVALVNDVCLHFRHLEANHRMLSGRPSAPCSRGHTREVAASWVLYSARERTAHT